MRQPIQFHWRLIQGGEPDQVSRSRQLELDKVALPDLPLQKRFCAAAEEAGIESLLTDISYGKPDPLLLASHIIPHTEQIKFLVAIKSGIISPTYFVQQVNTFAAAHEGRILLNVVAGHSPVEQEYYGDFLPHDERYARTHEFLHICNALWHDSKPFDFDGNYYKIRNGQIRTPYTSPNRKAPYIFVAGGSQAAIDLAIAEGDCWMRLADIPSRIAADAQPAINHGIEVGLRMAIIARDTKEEAVSAAYQLLENVDVQIDEKGKEKSFVTKSDSVMMRKMYELASEEWLTPWLWTGAVKTFGAPTIAMVGTPDELSDAIMEYRKAGITQYIFSGWPKQKEMTYFGQKVLPLVRKKEQHIQQKAFV